MERIQGGAVSRGIVVFALVVGAGASAAACSNGSGRQAAEVAGDTGMCTHSEPRLRVTELNDEGRDGGVRIVVLAVPRRRLGWVFEIIERHNPAAFVTVEDIAVAQLWRRAVAVRK